MIKGFKCKATEALFRGLEPAGHLRPIAKAARRKLDMIDYAEVLRDLRAPPGNRLEALKGDRRGQHSIRINDQWRICFVWRSDGPYDVEIVDYH
jgi:proteic killer suppression protein